MIGIMGGNGDGDGDGGGGGDWGLACNERRGWENEQINLLLPPRRVKSFGGKWGDHFDTHFGLGVESAIADGFEFGSLWY